MVRTELRSSPVSVFSGCSKIRPFSIRLMRASLCYEVSDRDGEEKSLQSVQENKDFIDYCEQNPSDMNAQARRAAIYEVLRQATQPVSATALAKQFSVSRQVIVSDVALMPAAGSDIYATPRGYTVTREIGGIVRQIACQHGPEAMRDELNAMEAQIIITAMTQELMKMTMGE